MTERVEQRLFDKSEFPDGPWKDEPDRVSWVDPKTGYKCLILRHNHLGSLCGYVAVDNKHPFYRHDYQDNGYKISSSLDVHGGVTFTGTLNDGLEESEYNLLKDDEHLWWIGFDCAHSWDIVPSLFSLTNIYSHNFPFPYYRDIHFVTSEVESLARQLKEKEKNDATN